MAAAWREKKTVPSRPVVRARNPIGWPATLADRLTQLNEHAAESCVLPMQEGIGIAMCDP
ncbi:hypothetical protein [Lysobacter sp. Root690]|uniref:hypothetical protein n=1 Tax=Lysobacter sp. Root690 TaxID=1736588 RepID=UPI0006FDEA15|nr:hypothetical protein [Lysobacter sp. Root690]KRB08578.1 hypothetical protein ASD86_04405 [Lysobacter sp. Root690]